MTRRKPPAPTPTQVYAQRLESLLGAVWADAMAGETKSVEVARRILAQQGKSLGLDAEVGAAPICDQELIPDDELASFRKRYVRKPA